MSSCSLSFASRINSKHREQAPRQDLPRGDDGDNNLTQTAAFVDDSVTGVTAYAYDRRNRRPMNIVPPDQGQGFLTTKNQDQNSET